MSVRESKTMYYVICKMQNGLKIYTNINMLEGPSSLVVSITEDLVRALE